MADADSVRFSGVTFPLSARSNSGVFTVTVPFGDSSANGMGGSPYAANVTLQGSPAALASTSVRGIVSKTDTSLVVALNNTSAIASNTLWLNVLIFPTT